MEAADGARRFRMRQQLVSVGGDSWIEDEAGQRVLKVDGKALRLRRTIDLQDPAGATLLRIQERKLRVRDTMVIESPDGRTVATVRKALVAPLRDRLTVEIEGGPELDVRGDLIDHEYEISADGVAVARVTKRWFRIRDTYGIEVAPGNDPVLLLAVAAALDAMTATENDDEG